MTYEYMCVHTFKYYTLKAFDKIDPKAVITLVEFRTCRWSRKYKEELEKEDEEIKSFIHGML